MHHPLENGGTIQNAQAIAAHESPRTTKLYDRASDELTLDEIVRIAIWFRTTMRTRQPAPAPRSVRVSIARDVRHLWDSRAGDDTWWCVHPTAEPGDVVAVYKTAYGIAWILQVIRILPPEPDWCGAFGMRTANVRVLKTATRPITYAQMRDHPVLSTTGAVRNRFQGKIISISEQDLTALIRLIDSSNS